MINAAITSASARRPSGGYSHRIMPSDRVYAKLVRNGETLVEFVRDNIEDFSALLAMLRRATYGHHGLVRMVVRNISRGWSLQRPLMLYPDCGPAHAIADAKAGIYPTPWQTH